MKLKSKSLALAMVYNPYATNTPESISGYEECSHLVKFIIREMCCHRKVLANYELAKEITRDYVRRFYSNSVIVEDADIDEAWAIGCGGGCEYEWQEFCPEIQITIR